METPPCLESFWNEVQSNNLKEKTPPTTPLATRTRTTASISTAIAWNIANSPNKLAVIGNPAFIKQINTHTSISNTEDAQPSRKISIEREARLS